VEGKLMFFLLFRFGSAVEEDIFERLAERVLPSEGIRIWS
jgi:hypothetical protein